MSKKLTKRVSKTQKPRVLRADAKRNVDSLLEAALSVFKTSGVDAPVREIAEKAGVGIGTVYRNFPKRSDLIIAVFRQQVDACANSAATLACAYEPFEALTKWIQRYADFIAAKRGLAAALHSGDPAFKPLPHYFKLRLEPVLKTLLKTASTAGEIRTDIKPYDLLRAVGNLCMQSNDGNQKYSQQMVALLIDGLRYGARPN